MIFGDIEYTDNHGTSSGIIPRFFLQMLDLAEFAFDSKEEMDRLFENFDRDNIPDFTEFYDIFHELKANYKEYKIGLANGTFLKIQSDGTYQLDRGIEIEMRKSIKNFFIVGRRLINNFVQSEMIRDEKIDLRKLVIVNDEKFKKSKEKFMSSHKGISYDILFRIVEDARHEFLEPFNNLRDKIEHVGFKMPKFSIQRTTNGLTIIEPSFDGKLDLIQEIENYYRQILDFIENLMVYYYGLRAYERTNGKLTLYYRKDHDFPSLIYKYVIMIRIGDPSLTLLIN